MTAIVEVFPLVNLFFSILSVSNFCQNTFWAFMEVYLAAFPRSIEGRLHGQHHQYLLWSIGPIDLS